VARTGAQAGHERSSTSSAKATTDDSTIGCPSEHGPSPPRLRRCATRPRRLSQRRSKRRSRSRRGRAHLRPTLSSPRHSRRRPTGSTRGSSIRFSRRHDIALVLHQPSRDDVVDFPIWPPPQGPHTALRRRMSAARAASLGVLQPPATALSRHDGDERRRPPNELEQRPVLRVTLSYSFRQLAVKAIGERIPRMISAPRWDLVIASHISAKALSQLPVSAQKRSITCQ
jgi:hypothetical protein